MLSRLIDTHCHLDEEGYEESLGAVIEETVSELSFVINVGCCIDSSRDSYELSKNHKNIYFTAAIHPNYSNSFNESSYNSLKDLLIKDKAVAVGETGLDYYRDFVSKDIQKNVFREHLRLAKELNLPVVIHGREAYEDIVEILLEKDFLDITVVMHSYAGTYENIERILDRAYISFSGMITFSKNKHMYDVVKKIPKDNILYETDAPYLSPIRGQKNRPIYTKIIAEKIAEIRETSLEDILNTVYINAKRVFKNIK
jgi:TatD DNase family protein